MKAVKIVFGSLFGLYAVMQVLSLFAKLFGGNEGEYAQSALLGNISAIAIGGAIAMLCFRSALKQKD